MAAAAAEAPNTPILGEMGLICTKGLSDLYQELI